MLALGIIYWNEIGLHLTDSYNNYIWTIIDYVGNLYFLTDDPLDSRNYDFISEGKYTEEDIAKTVRLRFEEMHDY